MALLRQHEVWGAGVGGVWGLVCGGVGWCEEEVEWKAVVSFSSSRILRRLKLQTEYEGQIVGQTFGSHFFI